MAISTPTTAPTATPSPLQVHVSGAVANPGVYCLPDGSRVHDALAAAGGASPQAALDLVNLAAWLSDGQKVHVPTQEEAALTLQQMSESGVAGQGRD